MFVPPDCEDPVEWLRARDAPGFHDEIVALQARRVEAVEMQCRMTMARIDALTSSIRRAALNFYTMHYDEYHILTPRSDG